MLLIGPRQVNSLAKTTGLRVQVANLSPECHASVLRRRFARSTAGAKERVARRGAHTYRGPRVVDSGGGEEAPGPLTQASAPEAPGRLAREDARSIGGGTLEMAASGVAGHVQR